ncbi:hypothetical protein EEB19_15570 [Gordonia sp. OPL2]|nr:hypothetical protein EEB19_15570 [Gordonia sp. OPL2]
MSRLVGEPFVASSLRSSHLRDRGETLRSSHLRDRGETLRCWHFGDRVAFPGFRSLRSELASVHAP